MSYRPIADMWFLARAKLKDGKKYYGAYMGGFPERARSLLCATINEPVLHVCGGMARYYPYKGGFGVNDKTLDIDATCEPDYLQDATEPLPKGFKAMLIDPPYSAEDSQRYNHKEYPNPNVLVKQAIEAIEIGCRVGIIHYIIPMCPKNAKFVACVGTVCGFNNRIRAYSVFEKLSE